MRKLFDTADLEAELFAEDYANPADPADTEFDLSFEEAADLDIGITEDSIEDFPALEFTLTLADGRTLDYEAVGIFIHEDKEYMALHPKTDTEGTVHLMEMTQGVDDELQLMPVPDEEFDAVAETFQRLYIEESEIE